MFKDYYAILEVAETATPQEIKSAYKRQALKWHPDRNLGNDTTKRMQEINEAYLILKDVEARERYSKEYQRFKQYRQQQETKYEPVNEQKEERNQEQAYDYSDYKVEDDILYSWIKNARRQAVDLAIQTIKEMGELSVVGSKAAGKEMGNYFIGYLVAGVVIALIFSLAKSCN